MTRYDIRGVERAPQETQDYLLRIGGSTPFDEPIWRLVLARNVVWKVAGGKVWNAGLSVSERGGFDLFEGRPYDNQPLRDESGKLVEQQRYPHLDGWILQRWFPTSAYSKTQWFAAENCLPDGTPKLGPFPQYGDYEMVGGPMERAPGKQELHDFVSAYYHGLGGPKRFGRNPSPRSGERRSIHPPTRRAKDPNLRRRIHARPLLLHLELVARGRPREGRSGQTAGDQGARGKLRRIG